MSLDYGYKRYFIMLQEEDKGYEIIQGKTPTGYVKIELRRNVTRVTGFIQNVVANSGRYKLMIISHDKQFALDLGEFRVKSDGSGEICKELNSNNVQGSGLGIHQFTSALVASGTKVPLFGSIDREVGNWRDWYNKKDRKTDEKDSSRIQQLVRKDKGKAEGGKGEKTGIEVAKSEDKAASKVATKGEDKAGPKVATKIEDTVETKVVKVEKEIEIKADNTDDQGEVNEERKQALVMPTEKDRIERIKRKRDTEIVKIESQAEEKGTSSGVVNKAAVEESNRNIKGYSHRFHHMNKDSVIELDSVKQIDSQKDGNKELINILRSFQRFQGFRDDNKIDWFVVDNKFSLFHSIIITINGVKMPLSYPYTVEGCGTRAKNCIFGIECDNQKVKNIYIGISGLYKKYCEPCFNFRGFSLYKKPESGKSGYWIMGIDYQKGRLLKL